MDDTGFRGLRLYNTLTRRKDDFVPIDAARVRMYVCGPTVYDHAHIGNARPIIVFDVLYRLLRHLYGESHVVYVRNITDVDDKINARAAAEGIAIGELTERTTAQFHADIAALGALPPDVEPRATAHVSEMQAMIVRLIETGHAYAAEGHVLFHVPSMPDYGKLAGRSVDEMQAGARVEVAPYKRDPMDFVLWKPSKEGEPSWPSPWGSGRPGWHIECSAMAETHLGETFDIHGGGIDLVFPHHENEVAQSTCAHGGAPMARYWLHNGFLQVEGRKMAKSEGNFVTIHDLLATMKFGDRRWSGRTLRYAMLKTHYRQPIDWTYENAIQAAADLDHFSMVLHPLEFDEQEAIDEAWSAPPHIAQPVLDALLDDLNTAQAITELHTLANGIATDRDRIAFAQTLRFLGIFERRNFLAHSAGVSNMNWGRTPREKLDPAMSLAWQLKIALANDTASEVAQIEAKLNALGFKRRIPDFGLADITYEGPPDSTVDDLIEARNEARRNKNFKEADRIRDELDALGFRLRDMKNPETGKIETVLEPKR